MARNVLPSFICGPSIQQFRKVCHEPISLLHHPFSRLLRAQERRPDLRSSLWRVRRCAFLQDERRYHVASEPDDNVGRALGFEVGHAIANHDHGQVAMFPAQSFDGPGLASGL